jgi:hypothetical protein
MASGQSEPLLARRTTNPYYQELRPRFGRGAMEGFNINER